MSGRNNGARLNVLAHTEQFCTVIPGSYTDVFQADNKAAGSVMFSLFHTPTGKGPKQVAIWPRLILLLCQVSLCRKNRGRKLVYCTRWSSLDIKMFSG